MGLTVSADWPGVPLLRYPGAKNRLAAWILAHVPQEHDVFIDVCGGSGAVLLSKERSRMEIYNDKSDDLWNLFRVMRDRRDELIERIQYTPWSVREFQLCQQAAEDEVERARRFYFRCWASIRPFDNSFSFRRQKFLSRGRMGDKSPMTPAAAQFSRIDHLYWIADRLRGVVLENMDAVQVIRLYDSPRAFFYVDLPYPLRMRAKKSGPTYPVEMMGTLEHIRMAKALWSIQGMAAVSGYATNGSGTNESGCENRLYHLLYERRGWQRVDQVARIDGGGSRVESLWISPKTAELLEQERQLMPPLLALMGVQDGNCS